MTYTEIRDKLTEHQTALMQLQKQSFEHQEATKTKQKK